MLVWIHFGYRQPAWTRVRPCQVCVLLLCLTPQDIAKRDHQKKLQEMREWSDDELRMLDKAVKKFPMGTPRRWEQVCMVAGWWAD